VSRHDRFGERTDDDLPICTRCSAVLIKPESIAAGRCIECRLNQPLKPKTLADTGSAWRRKKLTDG
jgi:hypothetical protein